MFEGSSTTSNRIPILLIVTTYRRQVDAGVAQALVELSLGDAAIAWNAVEMIDE